MDFIGVGTQIGELVQKKNAAYGDSFNQADKIIKILYPNGISVEQYPDMLCVIRIVDKLFRVATDKDFLGESPFADIAGYGILGVHRHEHQDKT